MSQESIKEVLPIENQQQRWMKYGANVVLVSVIVIALAVMVIYIGQIHSKRFDTTQAGLYSLKPQTLSVIKDNKQKITIVSLYTKAKPGEADVTADDDSDSGAGASLDQAGVVADLLEEYRTRGSNIETESIDPVLNTAKVESLIDEISTQYGGEIAQYKKFVESLPAKYSAIGNLANPEAAKIQPLLKDIQDDEAGQAVALALISVRDVPDKLKQSEEAYQKYLKQKPPNYKGITDSVSDNMQAVSAILGKVIDDFGKLKDTKTVAPEVRQYMTDSIPRYTDIKQQADSLLADQKKLGELKLDTLRDALKQKNSILVRGEKEWRVIPYEKVWKTDARDTHGRNGESPRPRFAGEQMITTAILALDQPTKTKVCFIRAGGPPITEFGGRLNSVADRLRDYNFDVSEKDLSGTWAMQAMQQQQQPTPEPSDEDIADAVWIVDGAPAQQNPMMGGPPPSIAPKIADHLTNGKHWLDGKQVPGGSAFLLFIPRGEAMTEVLSPWGISARTDAMCVHTLIKNEGAVQADIINSAQHTPFIFTFNSWGDHIITHSLASLQGILLQAAPIQVTPKEGVTSTALIPVPGAPNAPDSWGETDLASVETGPKYDSATDIAAPIYAAAAAEKSGQRIVCMGSEPSFLGSTGDMSNNIVDFPDQELLEKQRIYAPAFPGDGEFFMNSVFWLTHQEAMISISPAAMSISRIGEMSPPVQKLWHIGVLLIGLPGLVLVLGCLAYLSRRD